jgi:hypothetical protein
MNKLLLKQILILSAFLGLVIGLVTLIPVVGKLAFITLMCFTSAIIIVFMQRLGLMEQLDTKASVIFGAIIGFVAFIAFSIVYLPATALLDRFFNVTSGISIALRSGTFGIISILVIFMGILAATMNAFSAFMTFYVIEFIRENR